MALPDQEPALYVSALRWLSKAFIMLAFLPPFYGAFLNWTMYWDGHWDQFKLHEVAFCIGGTVLLTLLAILVRPKVAYAPVKRRRRKKAETEEAGSPENDPPVLVGYLILIVAVAGFAVMIACGAPSMAISSFCDFGLAPASSRAYYCRRHYNNDISKMLGLVGFGGMVGAFGVLYLARAIAERRS